MIVTIQSPTTNKTIQININEVVSPFNSLPCINIGKNELIYYIYLIMDNIVLSIKIFK